MAQGRRVTQTTLNTQLDAISQEIYQIDIQIQDLKQQGNQGQLIQALEAKKLGKQRDIVNLQIQLELLKAWKRWRH